MEESTMVWLPKGYQIQSFLRIASISVALYDYLETAPTAYRFYREQWRSRRLTASCVLFMLLRLFSIIALTLSSVGFFYGGFNPKSCERFFLLPPIFKVLQIMVSQAILGFRVYNLAQRSEKVLYVGLFVYITTCSLQWVSTLVERDAVVDKHVHNCRAFSEQPKHLGAWVFYTIAMVYDILMTLTSVFYLLRYKLTSSSGSLMLKLVNMMLSDGLGYLIALTATNAINVTLYKTSTDIQSAAASLGYCLTWIMSQRLLIHLHDASRERRMESEDALPAYTITSDILSPRELSELVRTQLTHTHKHSRSNPASFRHQPHSRQPYDLERTDIQVFPEGHGVHPEHYPRRLPRKPPG